MRQGPRRRIFFLSSPQRGDPRPSPPGAGKKRRWAGNGKSAGGRAPEPCKLMSCGASRAAPWAAAAFCGAWAAGRGRAGRRLGESQSVEGTRGPPPAPAPAAPPVAAGGGGGPGQHPPTSAPAPPFARSSGACSSWSLASAVKGSLTLISSCGGPRAGGPQKGLLFLSW